MTEYQLEIKQHVEYPRCRIYKKFVEMLMCDPDIKTSGGCGLYHYTVLSSFANFETKNRKISGISYTVFPGELLCTIDELLVLLRVKNKLQALAILTGYSFTAFSHLNSIEASRSSSSSLSPISKRSASARITGRERRQ